MRDLHPTPATDPLFDADGEMAARMRTFDWAATPLGPPHTWPGSLRTYVHLMLTSKQPMYLAWTSDLIALYNDAYRPILGADKHPWALGSRTADIFGQDGYPGLKPVFDAALRGESAAFENLLVPLVRHGYMEECYFDVGYTPVYVDQFVGGVFSSVTETTGRLLSARRTQTLAALTAALLGLSDAQQVARAARQVAEQNPHDLPCLLLYLPTAHGEWQLAGAVGLNDQQLGAWRTPPPAWLAERTDHVLPLPPVDAGPWPEPVTQLAALPLTPPQEDQPLGLLAVGLNARKHLDHAYRDFLHLFSGQLTAALRNAGLTEQLRQRHAELTRERELLTSTNEELEAFAYSVSHDLRTPVRHVLGFNDLLRKSFGAGLDAKGARYLALVDQAAVRMNTVIDAMLDLSRTSRQPLRLGVVDLGALVASVRAELEADVLERHVTWRVSALPLVTGDDDLLRQVMMNLLSNAQKYTRGREEAVIEVWAEERAAEWAVFVRDNGAGFDSRYADKLFGVFQRLHRQEEFEGTGVGLANVRRIVTRHGGQVWAHGVLGEGATFAFTLPKPG